MLPHILLLALASPASAVPASVDVPVRYQAGRVIAEPRTAAGETLKLWVDTGGGGGDGMYLLTDAVVRRLHLKTGQLTLGKESIPVTDLPVFAAAAGVPAPAGPYARAVLVPAKGLEGPGDPMHYDGMLGAGYLPGSPATHDRVWTFDYPGQRLTLQGKDWHPDPGAHVTPLHFPLDAQGHLTAGFARIVIKVDGQPLSVLLDTGATGYPTASAMTAEGGHATVRATSFITTSQFERWHKAHPGWRVVQDADRLRMKGASVRAIEVRSIEIAGWQTGPVWFTERPDSNFHDFMSGMMDSRVEGALGGNAFEHFAMTVDYGRAQAWFRCVRGCKPAPGGP
jgi:hypothetical protein